MKKNREINLNYIVFPMSFGTEECVLKNHCCGSVVGHLPVDQEVGGLICGAEGE